MPYEPIPEHTPSAMTGPPGPVIVTTQPDVGTPLGIPTAPQRVAILTPEAWAWITGGAGNITGSVGPIIRYLADCLFKAVVVVAVLLGVNAYLGHGCPGPGPGPVPPIPPIPPGPTPGVVTNPRVLMLCESADLTKYPQGVKDVLQGQSTRNLLDTKLPLAPDGKTHAWRIWDIDADPVNEAQMWKDLMAKKPSKDKLPYVMIAGDGGIAYEGGLPPSPDEFAILFGKYVK